MNPEPPDLPPPAAEPPPLPSPDPAAALAADAAGAHTASALHAHAHTAGNTHCLNCGTPLSGPYCSACGQHDFDFHRSFWHVFLEALENILHFDGKFFRNIVTLLFRPGRLTAEFNAGKRASQVPPFRLYIFTAFFFFLLVFAGGSGRDTDALRLSPGNATAPKGFDPVAFEAAMKEIERAFPGDSPVTAALQEKLRESQTAGGDATTTTEAAPLPANTPQISFRAADRPAPGRSAFERWLEQQGSRLADPQFRRELSQRFLSAVPKMLLLCLPLFALFTRVLHLRAGQVYLQHLVIALHFHTFVFLWLMFRDGWAFLAGIVGLDGLGQAFLAGANLWLAAYPVLMLRRLFGESWPRTILKSLALAFGYMLALAAAFFTTAVVLVLLA